MAHLALTEDTSTPNNENHTQVDNDPSAHNFAFKKLCGKEEKVILTNKS